MSRAQSPNSDAMVQCSLSAHQRLLKRHSTDFDTEKRVASTLLLSTNAFEPILKGIGSYGELISGGQKSTVRPALWRSALVPAPPPGEHRIRLQRLTWMCSMS